MNEVNEIKKIVKISTIIGGLWGFVNGLFLILSSIDSAPNTTFFGKSIVSYFFLPYVITSKMLTTTIAHEIFSNLNVGTNEMGGLFMNNIIAVPVMIVIPTLIGAIVILLPSELLFDGTIKGIRIGIRLNTENMLSIIQSEIINPFTLQC